MIYICLITKTTRQIRKLVLWIWRILIELSIIKTRNIRVDSHLFTEKENIIDDLDSTWYAVSITNLRTAHRYIPNLRLGRWEKKKTNKIHFQFSLEYQNMIIWIHIWHQSTSNFVDQFYDRIVFQHYYSLIVFQF